MTTLMCCSPCSLLLGMRDISNFILGPIHKYLDTMIFSSILAFCQHVHVIFQAPKKQDFKNGPHQSAASSLPVGGLKWRVSNTMMSSYTNSIRRAL